MKYILCFIVTVFIYKINSAQSIERGDSIIYTGKLYQGLIKIRGFEKGTYRFGNLGYYSFIEFTVSTWKNVVNIYTLSKLSSDHGFMLTKKLKTENDSSFSYYSAIDSCIYHKIAAHRKNFKYMQTHNVLHEFSSSDLLLLQSFSSFIMEHPFAIDFSDFRYKQFQGWLKTQSTDCK